MTSDQSPQMSLLSADPQDVLSCPDTAYSSTEGKGILY